MVGCFPFCKQPDIDALTERPSGLFDPVAALSTSRRNASKAMLYCSWAGRFLKLHLSVLPFDIVDELMALTLLLEF